MTPGTQEQQTLLLAHDVRVLAGRLRRALDGAYHNDQLTPSQLSVLSRLARDGDLSASELAAAERVRAQSMSAIVARLEERGFVVRRPHASDGRRRLLALTPLGEAWIQGRRRTGEEWFATTIGERYDASEFASLGDAIALLSRIVD